MAPERYGVEVTGVCRICNSHGPTEMHHIISQSKANKIDRPELITNPGNIVELCIKCHELTDSFTFYELHKAKSSELDLIEAGKQFAKNTRWKKKKRKKSELYKIHGRCLAMVRGGRRRCYQVCEPGEVTCRTHRSKRKEIEDTLLQTKLTLEEE